MSTSQLNPVAAAPLVSRQWLSDYSMPLAYLVLFAVLSATVENFFSLTNVVGLMLSVAQIGMVACTMMLCLASRDFDLSVGSTIAFAGVLGAIVLERSGSVAIAVAAGLGAGALIGALNGVLIAYLRVNALIATLATMLMVRGLAFIVSKGQAVGINDDSFIDFGDTRIFGLPLPVLVAGACFVVFGILLNQTVFGRNTLAIGGNPEAARLAGVRVERLRVWIFLLQGVVTAMAGLILASRITSGQPNAAQGFELDVISACVLGGVSLQGGKARIFGVLIGVLIMGTVENVMNLLDVDAFYQYLMRGLILLIAVLLDQLKTRGERR
ncbi:L-arabinose ABC transporter permease AraH [Pseudoduganella sp. FT25W]|jgi:L-arabinose transport system permease protein|uniref:L-arabinose ABC transporter permease AraH n=1 Tax=Duganella alba TaxID=2666081 RepID=A0A6L5QCL8_9BURK|nr:L-arabinose ABC transporter permease AraH [Duganella alba]MRX07248.1 L-arabinose ABC transporter permease AraH [Duganella alba]MRX15057.1 L-arabinose ABC transporter permease AraH [Duganella alba]